MRVADISKLALLVWLAVVIVAAFFYVHAAEGFIGESSRIVFFHVPMAWIAVLAFLVSCITSVMYLRRRDPKDDIRASVSAGLGLLFAVLATTTGAVFAKIMWGAYWNWDPRQTSITILLLIYAAYLALRGAVDDPERRASLCGGVRHSRLRDGAFSGLRGAADLLVAPPGHHHKYPWSQRVRLALHAGAPGFCIRIYGIVRMVIYYRLPDRDHPATAPSGGA